MINQHNLEADLGLHTYTLKINQFADMVCLSTFYFQASELIKIIRLIDIDFDFCF